MNFEKPTPFHSGKRLALARKLKGFTQEELAGTLGFPAVSVKTLRRWEQKGVNPVRLKEVADFFQLSLNIPFSGQRIWTEARPIRTLKSSQHYPQEVWRRAEGLLRNRHDGY